ncbi:MAG: putative 2-succinyl-6-hydroxy-2,4-cyclohexadiene-carboxylate synthase [Pseudomonadota bacterium]|jgi:2-succinyl-6-hydroxy-2,4-cyclohexadiene-1-carboxylate synthase
MGSCTSHHVTIHAFSGFLGRPDDWSFLPRTIPTLGDLPVFWKLQIVDPLEGENWNDWSVRWLCENPRSMDSSEILLGYSLGGRAGLHLALNEPSRFQGLIAISTNPGLESEEERADRRKHDEQWALRFLQEPWAQVLSAWDRQPVFQNSALPERLSARYGQEASPEIFRQSERLRCARQLRQLSLGAQQSLSRALQQLALNQVWMTGAHDLRYSSLAETLTHQRHQMRWSRIPNTGHRWPWELSEKDSAEQIRSALSWLLNPSG